MKRFALSLVAVLLVIGAAHAQSVVDVGDESRGFMFELGLGAAAAAYPEPLESNMNNTAASPGVDRIGLGLHATLGYAITPNGYVTAGVYGIADRLSDNFGDFIQVNTYLYGPGYRFYPFDTGLVIGGDLGAARMVVQTSVVGSGVSPWGFGWRAVAGYDFDATPTGFAAMLGISVGSVSIDGGSVGLAELFLSVVWK